MTATGCFTYMNANNDIVNKSAEENVKTKTRFDSTHKWKLFIASVLYPTVILLFFYTRNAAYVPLNMLLMVCGAIISISSIIWWLAYLCFRFPLSAFVLCSLVWTVIFAVSLLFNAFPSIFDQKYEISQYLILIAVFTLLVVFALKLRGKDRNGTVSLFLSVFTGIFFIFNAFSTMQTTSLEEHDLNKNIKTLYNVETLKKRPDIYWIHCDGMLGFSAMDRYFGDAQEEFKQALIDRGFVINEDATLESGHSTTAAIPALMCPSFYDNYLSDLLEDHESACETISQVYVQQYLRRARLNNEFIHAFEAGGYNTYSISIVDQLLFPTTDRYYYPLDTEGTNYFSEESSQVNYSLAVIEDLPDEAAVNLVDTVEIRTFLNTVCRPLGYLCDKIAGSKYSYDGYFSKSCIIDSALSDEKIKNILLEGEAADKYEYMVNALNLAINQESPKLTIILDFLAHRPFVYDEYGNLIENADFANLNNYPAQHKYAAKVLINLVDMILEKDPDALIILQGDHGLHENSAEDFKKAFGDDFSTIDLWNNVLSCYRIPAEYKTDEEENILHDPRNVSRYLINNYIGHNYDYLYGR